MPRKRIKTGSDLRKWRNKRGITCKEFAVILGVHWNTILRWEREELKIKNPIMLDLALECLERKEGLK